MDELAQEVQVYVLLEVVVYIVPHSGALLAGLAAGAAVLRLFGQEAQAGLAHQAQDEHLQQVLADEFVALVLQLYLLEHLPQRVEQARACSGDSS